ncbi:CotH kinase family protein [Flavobacterium sp.]|uniref:CotH kinase family protein n=1 Tax=Flavobacterium sp. TaxID=239 RepID=UPI00374DEC82
MKKIYTHKLLICIVLISYSFQANSQTFTDSNLPIVIINTDIDTNTGLPLEILDDPRILASMKIIKHPDGTRNYMTDENTAVFLNYNGRINIEIRGSSSQTTPKKPYGLTTLQANNTTNNNVSLLGMPSENDWILNAVSLDKSLIRDYLCYNLSRQMGNYASRTEYCEVVINGDYKGLYILQEKIKADSGRVNILKITTADNTLPNITGGYITKADKLTGGDPIAWTMGETNFIHELPKPIDVTPQQDTYIEGEFNKLAANTYNQSLLDGYTSVIDVPSFVDFMLVNELASNADVYQFSTFFHKDRNGKLRAGPIWDFDLTFGSTFTTHSDYDVWQFSNGNRVGPDFWNELTDNGTFWCYFTKRWDELTQVGQPLNTTSLNTFIDNTVNYISEATIREQQRWGAIPTHAAEIIYIKDWLTQRITWMNNNLGSFASCANVVTPPLVISKINYNPVISGSFSSNDQEFIEITNTNSATINLSGVYFSQLGTTYQFPYNSTISGNSSLYLAANSVVFQAQNGFTPFGQYTRNLSNKSQKIVLADAFGNIIDTVEYFDTAPWPTAPDGNGSYLQLIDTSLNNNLASNWFANNVTLSVPNFNYSNSIIAIYPNPASNLITINSSNTINKIEIIDIYGKLVKIITLNENEIKTDISSFSKGIYFIKIYDENDIKTEKLIKN